MMKSTLPLLPLIALAAACTADAGPRAEEASARAQTRFAQLTEGRVAGPPQSCVSLRNLHGNESAGEGAIIFRTSSRNLIYVNRPPAGCPELDSGRSIKLRVSSTQLCRGDIIQVFDPVTSFSYGGCGLGDFQPYRRVR
jgi:hypothetical protein